jgi:hypothetical protein
MDNSWVRCLIQSRCLMVTMHSLPSRPFGLATRCKFYAHTVGYAQLPELWHPVG